MVFHREKNVELISQSQLKDLISYNPKTGKFISIRPRQGVNLGRQPGTIAGGKNPHRVIFINGRQYPAAHLAILYETGSHPVAEVMHINGDNTNVKYANLKQTDRRVDGLREGVSTRNRSGQLGVFYATRRKKWVARITHKRLNHELGYFSRKCDAIAARKVAEARLFG